MRVNKIYKNLPKSTKKLLNLGIILALLVALPLFIWSVINMTFDVREKAQTPQVTINLENEPYLGYVDAPVAIVMYSDFQCEFCKNFIDNTLSTILSNYPNEVKFIHKDFPITTLHPLAQTAALAGQCAYNQNKFWEMHSLIFENQSTLTPDSFTDFANTLALDTALFENCITDQATLDEINADIQEGTTNGINGTPTFFINDQRIDGAQLFEEFKSIIDQELQAIESKTLKLLDPIVSCRQINYQWNTVIDADGYFIDISEDANFTDFVSSGRLENDRTNYAFTNLKNNTDYFARITLANIDNFPQYVTSGSTKTPDNCPVNAASQPIITTNCDSGSPVATISWTGIPADFGFWIDISENSNFLTFYNKNVMDSHSTNSSNFRKYLGVGVNNNNAEELVLIEGQKYYSRIFNSLESNITEFTACTPTTTPTITPTATPTDAPGEPNSCGGTCGSNYNCKSNLYCYQGFCRNPICSSDSDCDCIVVTTTPTATTTSKGTVSGSVTKNKTVTPKSTTKASPKSTPNYTGGMTLIEKAEDLERDSEEMATEPENMFINKYAIYIVAGFGLIVLSVIIYALNKKRDNKIPHIVPPTNI